jgi:low affinity Fe/Cu permease
MNKHNHVRNGQKKGANRCQEAFHLAAHKVALVVGSPWAFAASLALVIGWLVTGPVFHFSDTWQLVINTATTIITFLMVFIIQNTQNRDTRAIQLKLDELLRAVHGARNRLVALETLTDEELDNLEKEFEKVRKRAVERKHLA